MRTDVILRPVHLLGVSTPEQYRAKQAAIIANNMRRLPESFRPPFASTARVSAYIAVGRWCVPCVCGEAPKTDPDWRLACCAGCGAIYDDVHFPSDREAIEAVLLKRPIVATRNWQEPETLDDLIAENLAHGVQI